MPHQYMVADELGISHGLLSQWKSKSDRFVAQVAKLGALRKVHDGPRRALHAEEEALYMSFINKRKNIGFPIDHFWLMAEMYSVLTHTRGPRSRYYPKQGLGVELDKTLQCFESDEDRKKVQIGRRTKAHHRPVSHRPSLRAAPYAPSM